MIITLLVVLGVLFVLVMIFVGIYNMLVQMKINVERAWANISVLLKQRFDEIPNLVKVCEGYMKYESGVLEKVTLARTAFMSAKSPKEAAGADNMLSGALKSLFAVSENYPMLKADSTFLHLQNRISGVETDIASRREYYNSAVAGYNTKIAQIPYLFFAGAMGYSAKELFESEAETKNAPEIKFTMPTL